MTTIADAVSCLEQIAPPELTEDWDNTGLLAGDPAARLTNALTCLTLTPDVVEEAIAGGTQLVVTHHPLPFRGVKTLTTGTVDGGSLWRLLGAGIAVYSPHTAYDSAAGGINQQWAERLALQQVEPMLPAEREGAGVGRVGEWTGDRFVGLVEAIKQAVNLPSVRAVPPAIDNPKRVAIACGSGGSLLELALAADCDVLLTGEMGFHECLRCRALGVGVVLTGHYASERFALETLAERLAEELPGVAVTASRSERDPLESL